MKIRAHLSIHDVAPETLPQVTQLLEMLAGCGPAMLLVIPGRGWTPADLGRLRDWQGQGHLLAGHGWTHRVNRRRGLYHQLHGRLLSRHVAEHLSLSGEEISALMRRCHRWFAEQGLTPPTHYVPPAWALGRVSPAQLADQPFDTVETLGGIRYLREQRCQRLPLLGYEADCGFRAGALRIFNSWNRHRAETSGGIRIAIHPHDLSLRLAGGLMADCRRYHCQAGLV